MKLKRKTIRVYNNNAIELLKDIPSNSIDLIVTDPPYKVTSRGDNGNTGGMLKKAINKKGKVFKYNNVKVTDYASELYRVLKNDKHCYVMCNNKNLIDMLNVFTSNGFNFCKSLIWEKGNKITGLFYMSCFEYVLFFYKGRGVKINNCSTPDLLHIPNKKLKDKNGKNLHDTEKPVKLMETLISNSSKENDIILDPFIGIGATPIACKNLNRRFIGYEIDPNYFSIAKERVRNAKS